MFVNNWLTRREMLTPNKTALIDTVNNNRRITYREWNRQVNRTAHFLREGLGVQKGDRVSVLAMNCVEYLDLWFACSKIGAILHLLNWRLTPHELGQLVADATPSVLAYGQEFAAHTGALRGVAESIRHLVALDQQLPPGDVPFSERGRYPDAEPPEVELAWDDAWAICYTGGSTGFPKGVIVSHGQMTAISVDLVTYLGLTADDVGIVATPLFHMGGFAFPSLPFVHVGGTCIVTRRFDADQTFDLLRDAGVTAFWGLPSMYTMLQQHPRWAEVDLSRLRICASGGGSLPAPVREKLWERGADLFVVYGLTEAGPALSLPPEGRRRKPDSVGVPLMHVDAKIVDDEGNECGPDQVGELLLRGPQVFGGYWNNPEETARAFTADGWFHTGDLFRRDSEEYYYIVGRIKEMIKSGGENIYCAEVESVLSQHPAVLEAALIGVADPKWGEVGRAIVVLKPGATLGADELIAFCQAKLARFKLPRSVVFVDALPTIGPGKVDRVGLKEKYGGG